MLKRLSNKTDDEAKGTLAMMVHTVQIENQIVKGTSYIDCFRGTDLRRTEICCPTFAGQICSGSTLRTRRRTSSSRLAWTPPMRIS